VTIPQHIGSSHIGEANTITFWKIKDRAQLEAIKLITNTSDLLFNLFGEDSYTASGPEESYTAHNLTIYLPSHDKSFEPYGDFEYLFTNNKYLNWKKMITAEFPGLSDQFIVAEKITKTRQELYQSEDQLKSYTEESERYSFFHRDAYIQSLQQRIPLLQQRITELRRELYPEYRRREQSFLEIHARDNAVP